MREKRVCVNQVELQIRDSETEDEALIFLHFSGANLLMWQRAVPYFQDRYRIILVDLRGHGKSARPATGYYMDEMARDVAGIMQELKLERAHVVGSSLGAEVGLSLAANEPEKVLSLVCDGALASEFGPYGLWEGSEAEFKEHVAGELERIRTTPDILYPSIDALADARRPALEKHGWWNAYVEAMTRYGAYRVDEGRYARGFLQAAHENYTRHYFEYRFEDYYPKVTCPLLMLPGEDVFENPRETAAMQGLCALAARGRIARVAGWDHPYGWLIDPEGACREVLEFLGSPAPGSPGG